MTSAVSVVVVVHDTTGTSTSENLLWDSIKAHNKQLCKKRCTVTDKTKSPYVSSPPPRSAACSWGSITRLYHTFHQILHGSYFGVRCLHTFFSPSSAAASLATHHQRYLPCHVGARMYRYALHGLECVPWTINCRRRLTWPSRGRPPLQAADWLVCGERCDDGQ